MKKYDVSREIHNPCANIYNFDFNFEEEVCTDNTDEALKKLLGGKLPEYKKTILDNGATIEYELLLPRKERYVFSEI